jgi:hypothetical protein
MTRRWRFVFAGAGIVALLAVAFWLLRGSCAFATLWPDSPVVEAAEKTDLERRLNQLLDETARAGTSGALAGLHLDAVSHTTATIRVRTIAGVESDFRAGQVWQAVYADHHGGFSPCVRVVFTDGSHSVSQPCCEVQLPRRRATP